MLHVVLIAICLILGTSFALRKQDLNRTTALVVIFSATATVTLLQSVGNYDPITYIGCLVLIFGRHKITWAAGALILALGNPEQAILCSVSLVILSQSQIFSAYRQKAVLSLLVSFIVWLVVMGWMFAYGVRENRLGLLPYFAGLAFENFLSNPPAHIWSWYGPAWILVISLMLSLCGRTRWILFVSLIALPGVATVITVDGARVFGILSFPVLLVTSVYFWQSIRPNIKESNTWLGVFLVTWVIAPSTTAGWGSLGTWVSSFTS